MPEQVLTVSPVKNVNHVPGMDPCVVGAPEGIRTPDLRFRRPTLYPLSYERDVGECPEDYAASLGERASFPWKYSQRAPLR